MDEVLAQLGSDDRRLRRQAQDVLVRAGEAARPFIEELVRQAPNEEARKNAQAALAQIEQNRTFGPSYVTLHLKSATPKEVFAELSRQCFAALPTWPDNLWDQGPWQRISVDVDRKPFWEVVPGICQQLGVDFRPFQYGMRLMRSGGMQLQGVSHIDGPFLVVANQITYTRTRNFAAGQGEQIQFGMNLSVYAEPKITVLRGIGTVNLDEVSDDRGNSLVPDGAPGPRTFYGGYGGFGGWSLYAPLRYPPNVGTKLVKFKGSTRFVIQTRMEKLQIPDPMRLKDTAKTVNGTQVVFKEMKKTGDTFQLRLKVSQPNFGGAEWQQIVEGVQTRLQVLDAAGHALDHRGMSSSGNNESIDMTVDFGRSVRPDGRMAGDPIQLVWEIPTETREITVPIEFRDLPLFDGK